MTLMKHELLWNTSLLNSNSHLTFPPQCYRVIPQQWWAGRVGKYAITEASALSAWPLLHHCECSHWHCPVGSCHPGWSSAQLLLFAPYVPYITEYLAPQTGPKWKSSTSSSSWTSFPSLPSHWPWENSCSCFILAYQHTCPRVLGNL